MARAYSVDLREREGAAFCAGASCRWVAAAFKVSPASVVKWAQRQRDTGSVAPNRAKPQPRSLAEHRDWLMARLEAVPDLTLRGLVAELGERGIATAYGSVWRIVHDAGASFKKDPVRRRAIRPLPAHHHRGRIDAARDDGRKYRGVANAQAAETIDP